MRLAFFISPHGFGHAARSAAVMGAILRRRSGVQFEIFTTVPRWFFETSVPGSWRFFSVACDVGLIQRSALHEDVGATSERLSRWVPFAANEIQRLADNLVRTGCDAVVCDIAPLGIAAARAAGLPCVLVENFTWDWVYRSYCDVCPDLGPVADYLEEIFEGADLRIRTVPYCGPVQPAHEVAPVSRPPRTSAAAIRGALGLRPTSRVVLVSMGGIPWNFGNLERVATTRGVTIIVPGGSSEERRFGSVITMPHRSRFYHPDLMHAVDGVVGKVGYSTVAEAWAAGVGMGWVRRPSFPESDVLAGWVERELGGVEITSSELEDGSWAGHIPRILACKTGTAGRRNGADQAAAVILEFLGC